MGQTHPALGRRRLLCGGRAVTGPAQDAPFQVSVLLSFAMALLVWAVVSGLWVASTNPLLCAAPFCNILAALLCFLCTALMDPGTLVKRSIIVGGAPVAVADASLEEEETPTYCRTCRCDKERGTYHCQYCDACTREIDHHCNVAGNCVGARNKLFFHSFLIFAFLSLMFEALNVILVIVQFTDSSAHFSLGFESVLWIVGGMEMTVTLLLWYLTFAIACGIGRSGNGYTARMVSMYARMFGARGGLSLILTDIPRTPVRLWGIPCFGLSLPVSLWPPKGGDEDAFGLI